MIADFERYTKNLNPFTRQEVEDVHGKSVCIVGCGGLGGYTAMTLARFGVGRLTLVDGDVFVSSNLNRQLFCNETNLGKLKAAEAEKALSAINSGTEVKAVTEFLDESNCVRILPGHDVVMDCLDSVPARLLLEDGCRTADIPFIHGAISGFTGQVACVFPGDDSMHRLYAGLETKSHDKDVGNPPFTPQLVSAIQCCEAIKLLTGRENLLRNKLLLVDMNYNEYQTVDLA